LKKDLNILLIDDNHDHVKIIVWALEQSEIKNKVTVIEDGKKALEILESLNEPDSVLSRKPDIVFLDINLPKVNGIDLLHRFKDDPELSSIPVIMLSSSDRIEDVKAAYSSGANTYISKSHIFNEVAQAVNTVCVYWANIAQLSTRS
jgi:CheY-like chemotaxis protein